MKKFAYLFTVGGKIFWSGDTEKTLPSRAADDNDHKAITDFIKNAEVGWFTTLTTGEFIFRTE
jgi:hypothetical protein